VPPWWALALASTVTAACDIGLNRYFKADALTLTLWVSVVQSLLLAPVLLMGPDYTAPFIAAAVLGGVLLAVFDVTLFSVAARYGGAPIPRILAARIWLTGGIWAAIEGQATAAFAAAHPLATAGILAALGVASACVWAMNRCPLTRSVVLAMLPALCAAVAQAITLKLALSTVAPEVTSAVLYAWITSVVEAGVCAALIVCWRGRGVSPHGVWPAAAVIGLTSSATLTLRFSAFIGAPNPGYIYVIALLASVWLALAYWALRIPDTLAPRAGFGLVAAAGALIWLTTYH
jgi:hypothetical protein